MRTRAGWVVAAAVVAGLLPGLAGAAPTASFAAHRGTAGGNNPAPLYVHFDATASVSSLAGDNAFFDLHYDWDFGDPNAGTWATNGLPKNRAIGGVAGHVFDRPGSYTVKLTVTDRTGASQTTTRTVVVGNPDQFWATTTACVSASGNFAGCPSGASQLVSADFTAAMQNRVGAGARRILFRRGETFVANTPWATPNREKTEALVSAFPATGPQPIIQISPSNTSAAIILQGSSVDTATAGGWRFVDLKITSASATNPARGIATSFIFDSVLLYKMDIGPTGFGFNYGADQSGLNVPHDYHAVVDTQLRGNTGTPVTNSGSCWFGGANHLFISGVVCGQANAWQMRIAYTNKAVISNIVINERAGAFEAIKLHCSLGPPLASNLHICRHMIFSDNVLAKERLNIAAGGNDEGTMQSSIFERNVLAAGLATQNPNNLHRFNLIGGGITLLRRGIDATMPRGEIFENNVCDGRSSPVSCVQVAGPDTKYDGLVLRNNLAFAPGSSVRTFFVNNSSSVVPVVQQGNVTTNVNPFVSANPNPLVRADFALKAGSQYIDKGVALRSRGVDLLGAPTPQGSSNDVGAVEFGSGGPVVVDGPPAPPVLLSVEVQP